MTIPKRNRRTIVVDHLEYHWTLPYGAKFEKQQNLCISIQIASGVGQLLRIDFESFPLVTPKLIEHLIIDAIERGWKPLQNDAPFVLKYLCQEIDHLA